MNQQPQSPTAPAADKEPGRKTPAEFEKEAAAFNAEIAEISASIAAEISNHQTIMADEKERHMKAIKAADQMLLVKWARRKTLIEDAAAFGVTARFARALLRKSV